MFSLVGAAQVMPVKVVVTTDRGLSADEVAEMAANKILSVSDTAHPAIREQAIAFRDRLMTVLHHYIGIAQRSERTTMLAQLRRAGHGDAADMLEKL